jgi:hypothetical protein
MGRKQLTPEETVRAYFAAWNTPDDEQRNTHLEECWPEDGVYVDRFGEVHDRESLAARIGRFFICQGEEAVYAFMQSWEEAGLDGRESVDFADDVKRYPILVLPELADGVEARAEGESVKVAEAWHDRATKLGELQSAVGHLPVDNQVKILTDCAQCLANADAGEPIHNVLEMRACGMDNSSSSFRRVPPISLTIQRQVSRPLPTRSWLTSLSTESAEKRSSAPWRTKSPTPTRATDRQMA